MTSTPAFKRWFGASKVVDERGQPLRVYHGTNAHAYARGERIEAFGTSSRGGAFFSSDPRIAGQYGERVYAVYLHLENPLPYGPKRDLRDLGVDTTSTRLSYDQLLDAVAVLLGSRRGHDREDLEKTLARYAKRDEASLADLLVQVGFGDTAAKSYARRYRARLIAAQTAYPARPQ
jgi:hypothetical protein